MARFSLEKQDYWVLYFLIRHFTLLAILLATRPRAAPNEWCRVFYLLTIPLRSLSITIYGRDGEQPLHLSVFDR
ncbi:hypothetical protein EDC04DRAFT_2824360 [Pisolithus marmoratus]|nr:hypothetical protein EDC04DRAFT_2824360 [Pisolithus marmoratus]